MEAKIHRANVHRADKYHDGNVQKIQDMQQADLISAESSQQFEDDHEPIVLHWR